MTQGRWAEALGVSWKLVEAGCWGLVGGVDAVKLAGWKLALRFFSLRSKETARGAGRPHYDYFFALRAEGGNLF